jgi:hypothetical protein
VASRLVAKKNFLRSDIIKGNTSSISAPSLH